MPEGFTKETEKWSSLVNPSGIYQKHKSNNWAKHMLGFRRVLMAWIMSRATEHHCCWFSAKVLFFSNKCFFHSNLNFYLNECTEPWKINICCIKTTLLLKMDNNDAILLCWWFTASGTRVDDSNQNQSSTLKFWEKLHFEHFLKMNFELHMPCHEYDSSNITNWQHISGGSVWQQIGNKFLHPPCFRS